MNMPHPAKSFSRLYLQRWRQCVRLVKGRGLYVHDFGEH